MKKVSTLSAVIFFAVIYTSSAQSIVIDENELSKLDSNIAANIKFAMDDFDAVTKGKAPLHAKLDLKRPLPADGGTAFYIGQGYELTIENSLARVGNVDGYFYGPIIYFNEQMVAGNSRSISDIKFYSFATFKKLRKE